MQYTGHFVITKKENREYNFFLMKKKLISGTVVVFLIILLLVGLLNYMAKGLSLMDAVLQGLLMAVIGAALMIAINLVSAVLRINSFYKQKKLADFKLDVVIDKDGVHTKSDRGSADLPWNRIQQITETGKAFYLFITENNANVLPKTQMQLPQDAETIRKLFQKNMEANRLRLK